MVIINFLFALSCPVHGEIDSKYKDQIDILTTKMLATGFSEEEIQRIFSDERVMLYPQILERSGKGLPYFGKKFGLLTKRSIERGRKFLNENKEVLTRVETTYGVDKEIVIAILRVETNLSKYVGKYPIFNSCPFLALAENRRSSGQRTNSLNCFGYQSAEY